jgi:hypothetical protein
VWCILFARADLCGTRLPLTYLFSQLRRVHAQCAGPQLCAGQGACPKRFLHSFFPVDRASASGGEAPGRARILAAQTGLFRPVDRRQRFVGTAVVLRAEIWHRRDLHEPSNALLLQRFSDVTPCSILALKLHILALEGSIRLSIGTA